MDEVKEHVYGLLKNDATMQGYTGYAVTDPRIYEWYPSFEPVLSTALPGYIVYRSLSPGRGGIYVDRAQSGDIYLHFDIFAYNSNSKGLIARRIVDLLDQYGPFATTNFRVLNMQVTEDMEMGVEGESSSDRRYRHHVAVRLIGVLNKNTIGNVV